MKVRFWGVRGAIPAPGPETNRYGGNTSCVSVTGARGQLLILDMGTGVVGLGKQLMTGEMGRGRGRAAVLLSHAHWDHIQGFPFFPPVFVAGNQFELHGNAHSSDMLEGILEGQMNPHFSPIYTLRNLGAAISFTAALPGAVHDFEGIRVSARPNPHGHTSALAYRLEEDGSSLVYASDAGYPPEGPSREILDLYAGADLLIHDSTYTPADRATRLERGNSSYAEAAAAAASAGARHLALFHYDQDYGDDTVDEMTRACRAELDRRGGRDIRLTAAAEGLEIDV
ncbi:MAG TPA: MBL fold metallo-hydrolase [Kofleriaceae bacterium]|nr:MBL fold metallo-hydrolase [Kofleriaceae bacterium]